MKRIAKSLAELMEQLTDGRETSFIYCNHGLLIFFFFTRWMNRKKGEEEGLLMER